MENKMTFPFQEEIEKMADEYNYDNAANELEKFKAGAQALYARKFDEVNERGVR